MRQPHQAATFTQHDRSMIRLALRLAAWLTLAAIIFVTVSPIGMRPHDVLPVNTDRSLAFALLAGLFVAAYPRHWIWVGLAIVLSAVGIEWLQDLSPTRHARLSDASVKAAGALLGVVVGRVGTILAERLERRRVAGRA